MKNDNKLTLLTFLGAKIEDNRIISEDMVPLFISANSFAFCLEDDEEDYNILDTINFDTSWDWLMLVVDKIESIVLPTLTIDLGYQECEFDNASFVMYISPIEVVIDIFGDMQREKKFITANNHKDKITNTFEACIQFIKWYNENKSK